MNTFTQLTTIIDTIPVGVTPVVTVLRSQIKNNRRSMFTPKTRGKGSIKVS